MLFLSIVLPHPVEESVVLYFICRQKLAKALRDKLSRPIIFTCVSYAEARIIAIGWTSVLLSVRPSVTRWYCIKTAQAIAKLSSRPGSPMILVLCGPKLFPEFQ